MADSLLVSAPAAPPSRHNDRSVARGPKGSHPARGVISLLVETFLEARTMTREANRRYPFSSE